MFYPGIFDTHAHYDDERFAAGLPRLLDRQCENGVTQIINAASDLPSAERSLELAHAHAFLFAAVGVHPHGAGEVPDDYLDRLTELAQHREAVAIGEIGLDYYYDAPARVVQRKVFTEQLALARELQLPVQIHDRDAHSDVFDLVREYRPAGSLHRYSGSVELAREYVKLGLFLGFGGALTYSNAKKERAVVREVPLQNLLLETDCPYLAPARFRGQTSTSDMLWVVAETIAELRGDVTPQNVVDITRENAFNAFPRAR